MALFSSRASAWLQALPPNRRSGRSPLHEFDPTECWTIVSILSPFSRVAARFQLRNAASQVLRWRRAPVVPPRRWIVTSQLDCIGLRTEGFSGSKGRSCSNRKGTTVPIKFGVEGQVQLEVAVRPRGHQGEPNRCVAWWKPRVDT